jgi:hypothetical protein
MQNLPFRFVTLQVYDTTPINITKPQEDMKNSNNKWNERYYHIQDKEHMHSYHRIT